METSLRADAARNEAAILGAAKEVFASEGVDAPLDSVLRLANVGRATLYRRFPTREDLFAAILRQEVENLTHFAEELSGAADPDEATRRWLSRWDTVGGQYRGMASRVGRSIAEGEGPLARLCEPMRQAFASLVKRAQKDGHLRRDLGADDILALLSALTRQADGRADAIQISVVLDGLYGQQNTHLRR
ncbi:TetR/AcrR family transcriptional regulator [Arthrobacter sp. NA-172]|jgi:AcrR family transcriptional regulator|uniref:TetR/AcrR family transcriptional regulator n=1 Tax=Arthrobacter sp. NA-172 TaxID=3367524 RepID=UPI003754374A